MTASWAAQPSPAKPKQPFDGRGRSDIMSAREAPMAKIGMMLHWLAAGALLMAPALVFATGDSEQSAAAETGAAMGGRFSEAPMLAARVAAGELPPVEERIPFDPVVQEMLADGVGRYGGTLRVSEATGFMNQRGGELTTQMLDIYLLTMHQQTLDIVPNIAAGYAVSDDGLTVTLELRPGTKWSNDDPFIVDDLMFVMEDMKWDDRVDPGWRASETPTTAVRITKIDDPHHAVPHVADRLRGHSRLDHLEGRQLRAVRAEHLPEAVAHPLQRGRPEAGRGGGLRHLGRGAGRALGHYPRRRPGHSHHDAVDSAGDQRPGGALGAQSLLLEGGPGGPAAPPTSTTS